MGCQNILLFPSQTYLQPIIWQTTRALFPKTWKLVSMPYLPTEEKKMVLQFVFGLGFRKQTYIRKALLTCSDVLWIYTEIKEGINWRKILHLFLHHLFLHEKDYVIIFLPTKKNRNGRGYPRSWHCWRQQRPGLTLVVWHCSIVKRKISQFPKRSFHLSVSTLTSNIFTK